MMNFQIITLFPERYESYVKSGLPARAYEKNLFKLNPVNLRDFADSSRPGRVDDAPYGGGPGMVLQVGPIHRALQSLPYQDYPVVLFTPRGKKLNQGMVRKFSTMKGFTLLPGFYEGVDERVANHLVDYQISIGDYVLNSGDLAALVFVEAITRLLPGYMGSDDSAVEESNEDGLLEYPQYTRPAEYEDWKVPDILLSGDHGRIAGWRKAESIRITQERQKEMLEDNRFLHNDIDTV